MLAASALGLQAAPPNLSVVVGERQGRTRSKHQLHVQGRLVGLFASDGGLIRAVVRALGALGADPPPGALALDAVLLLRPDGAGIAVDRRLTFLLRRLADDLRRHRWRVLSFPRLHVLTDRCAAVLPDGPAAVGIDPAALDGRWPCRPGEDDLSGGETAVGRLVYAGRPRPESRAHALAAMVPMVRDADGRLDPTTVARLAAFTERVEISGAATGNRAALATLLNLS